MTDRHAGYVVTLAEDVREDDAEAIITALRMTKGVASVRPIVSDFALQIAEDRARREMRAKVVEFLEGLGD